MRNDNLGEALGLCDRAAAGRDPDVAFEATVLRGEVLRRLDQDDQALQAFTDAVSSSADQGRTSQYGPLSSLIASLGVAILRLRRGEPDEAILLSATLAARLGEEPATWNERWLLRRCAELCWLLGTFRYYVEAVTLGRAILQRFGGVEDADGRYEVTQTRLMLIIGLRNADSLAAKEGEIDRAVAEIVNAREVALAVLEDWKRSLIDTGAKNLAGQLLTADTLTAMIHEDLGETDRALITLDQAIDRSSDDPDTLVQESVAVARDIRDRLRG